VGELVELFARVQRDAPDRAVLPAVSPSRARTAGQVWADAVEVAAALARAGVGAGSLVAVSTGNDPSTCAAWLGCRLRDAAVMPLDRASTAVERSDIMAAFRPAVSLVRLSDADRGEAAGGLRVIPSDVTAGPHEGYPGAAVLKLTSGTSGRPKATFTTEAQALADAKHIIEGMGIAPADFPFPVSLFPQQIPAQFDLERNVSSVKAIDDISRAQDVLVCWPLFPERVSRYGDAAFFSHPLYQMIGI